MMEPYRTLRLWMETLKRKVKDQKTVRKRWLDEVELETHFCMDKRYRMGRKMAGRNLAE